jgi:hypothetical protein
MNSPDDSGPDAGRSELEYEPKRLFTVDEANASLPLVRAIVQDLADLSQEVIERRERLSHLLAGRERDENSPYDSELTQVERELEQDSERLQEFVEELRDLGVEPKNGPQGLVDFPSLMDGRIVYLCWRLGEPEVLHWHELDAGFRGRQSLTAGSIAEGDSEVGGGFEV